MQEPPARRRQNQLLSALPPRDRRRLLDRCEPVRLALEDVLHEPGDSMGSVYFPTRSFISLIAPGSQDERLEVGMIGDEGMLGTSLVLGVNTIATRAQVQGAGEALKLDAAGFLEEMERSSALQLLLKRYTYVVMCQLAQTAVCTRFHVVEARLARWLLMTGDRAHSGDFRVTHEFLAYMLGVRRAGVTGAATALQVQGMLHYQRGEITILDRRALQRAACVCYAADRKSYASIMH
jgi:CRP-like cAMP-binding protein